MPPNLFQHNNRERGALIPKDIQQLLLLLAIINNIIGV